MPENERPVLSDPSVKPDDIVISSYIGDKIKYWKDIQDHCTKEYAGMEGAWRYYNDGKSWLFRMVLKKKTIFWSALYADGFKVTCYFGDKAGPEIIKSEIPEQEKQQFLTGRKYGKIRAISLKISGPEEVEKVKKIIAVKVRLK